MVSDGIHITNKSLNIGFAIKLYNCTIRKVIKGETLITSKNYGVNLPLGGILISTYKVTHHEISFELQMF